MEKSPEVLPDSIGRGGLTNHMNALDPPLMPRTYIDGSRTSGQLKNPFPQAMLRAMSSGHAFFGDDHRSRLRVGTLSE